ncbi:hypothetical protein ACP70R_002918 [Stipagrostis hirtigluma subsp. patula]
MPSRGIGGRARRRRARRRRDWAEGLPLDALLAILHRLGHVGVLMAADRVCRSWRRAARDEPSLWRRITMRCDQWMAAKLNRRGVACAAVRRSAGQCEAFCGEYVGNDGFLVYLSEQAPCLKSLRLISCYGVTDEGVTVAVKEFPLLEELEVSLCDNVVAGLYKDAGDVCPQLKIFRLNKARFDETEWRRSKDNVALATANMHGLRSLQLFANSLTNKGLEAILDNCPHLESLDIRHCFNVNMNEALRAKCGRIKTLRLSDDTTNDYEYNAQMQSFLFWSWEIHAMMSSRRRSLNSYYNGNHGYDCSFPRLSR